jgi:hypothetical protein
MTADIQVCEQCGQQHITMAGNQACAAHKKGTRDEAERGKACRQIPVQGGTVCRYHGGRAKQVRAMGQQKVAEQRARKLVASYGLPMEVGPEDAILAEVHRTAGHVAWLAEQVQALETGELVWGVTRIKEGGEDRGRTEEAVPNVWLKLYREERAHLVRVCAEAIKAGIEERRVRLAEQQGSLVADVIRAILGDLNLTAEQQAKVSEIVPRRLRAVAG